MLRGYSKFMDVLYKIEKIILTIAVAVMLLVMIYQVILRYIFSAANAWSEELARYLFILEVMIAAAIAVRKNSHLQIDVLIGLFSPRVKRVFTICTTAVGVVFLCFLLVYSFSLCKTGENNMSVGLQVPMSIPYTILPIGVVLMILNSVEVILQNIDELRQERRERT